MRSRVQSCDGPDACSLGRQKGTVIIKIDQLSDPASRKIFLPYPLPHFSSVAWLAKRRDRCRAGCWGVNPPSFLPPLHTPGHHAQDMKGGISGPTHPPNTYTAPSCGQTLDGPVPGAAIKVRCQVGDWEDRKLLIKTTLMKSLTKVL